MHLRISMKKTMTMIGILMLMMTLFTAGALALGQAKVTKSNAGIYKSTGAKSPAAKLKKNTVVKVIDESSKWIKVEYSGKSGYMKKADLKKIVSKAVAKYSNLAEGKSGASVKKLQARLASLGYLSKSGVTGKYGSATKAAVRKFQMFNSLSVSGKATVTMQKKLYSSTAKSKPSVSIVPWGSCGINAAFPNGSTAQIIDLSTGTRMNIYRLYGSNHCDVEPQTKADTAKLKAIYGGKWSWDSRGVLLIANGRHYAAAINSMPHGEERIKDNNYNGQFCLHLKDCKTHGSNKVNKEHQKNITKVYNYLR